MNEPSPNRMTDAKTGAEVNVLSPEGTGDSAPSTQHTAPHVTRRQLLVAAGATAAAVGFTGCQPPPREFMAESRVRLAEDVVSAFENSYATACGMCGAGCGTLVRVIEGRAKKVEGNPDHPVNQGKLCARGQAAVQEQYHPDRITAPLSRRALRGAEGVLLPDTWDQALSALLGRLRGAQQANRAGDVVLITRPLGGHQALIVDRFAKAYGAQWLTLDPMPETPLREAVKRVFGQDQIPDFDIARARFVLSFGADWLTHWLSPVHYGVAYGVLRQGSYRPGQSFQPRRDRPRGQIVHVSSHFSATAANADEWVPVRPGTEGLVALALANVVASEGLGDAGAFGGAGALGNFAPDRVAGPAGVDAERIRSVARAFAQNKPSLAFGGGTAGAHTNGTANLSAILGLNLLAGNVGQDGGVRFNAPPAIEGLPGQTRASGLPEFQRLVERLDGGQVQALLVYGANPVHDLPPWLRFRDALLKAPFVASFNSFLDDTTNMADMILPSHLPLEDWGSNVPDPGPGVPVLTIQQPVVPPAFDTRGFLDVLLALGEELGGPLQQALPWRSARDLLREEARKLQGLDRGSVREPGFEQFWTRLLQQGGWWGPPPSAPAGGAPAAGALGQLTGQFPQPQYAGDEGQYPFHLVVYEHHAIGHGEGAHLPWLASLPDPITTAVWRTWVEVNPTVARDMGLAEGDVVALESPHGRLEVPVYVSPAAPPNVLAVPLGWGHGAYGRWAKDRGVNPLALLAPLADETGAPAYAATRVRMSKTGRKTRIAKFEGNVPAYQLEHEKVLRVTRGEGGGR
ncbi:MAG TPA: molybdopterin-dependent oxidoreductase [Chloroflexota bacterium]|nr:molybdopterin-dependent oxidoreductase [Chloroflexota bacterium]